MRICKIYAGEYPWDVRAEKLIHTLLEHDHHVTLLCRLSNNRPETERYPGLTIHRFPLEQRGGLTRMLGDIPAFLNIAWTRFIHRILEQQKFDLILVRDLPLALNSISAARRYRIPVVLDMAENYPALFKDVLRFERRRMINFFLKPPFVANLIERLAINNVDNILVVVEESMKRLISLGVPDNKIVIVSNTPRLAFYQGNGSNLTKADELRLVYVGGFERARGLEWIIRMMPLCLTHIPNLHLYLIGDGRERSRLEELSVRCGVKERTHLLGWIEPARVPLHIDMCDIGLIPHIVTEHTNSTVPNKLFDYMYASKAVLASNACPLVRILQEENCGVTFRWGDTHSLLEGLKTLGDSQLRKQLGENGRAAVLRKYNWAVDEHRLIEGLTALVERSQRLQKSEQPSS